MRSTKLPAPAEAQSTIRSEKCPTRSSRLSSVEAASLWAKARLIKFATLTKRGYIASWHHEQIAASLEAVELGKIRRLMIFVPPQHGKSELASIRFPAWYLGRNPKRHIAGASYSADLATDFGRQVRNLAQDQVYIELFGNLISKDSRAADTWATTVGGRYVAVGVGGPLTGRGANLLVIDDPIKDWEEAQSEVIREKVWNWYAAVALTRVRKDGAIVLIQTRWHEDDLAGRILAKAKDTGEKWTIISLQAIAEEDERFRRAGEELWPGGKPLHELKLIRETQGSYKWNALYQQKPPKEQGEIFKREWFGKYRGEPPGDRVLRIMVLDSAHKTKKENHRSAVATFDLMTGGIFLRHVWKEKVTYPELKRKIVSLYGAWRPDELCIEDKDAGAMLIQELERDTILPVIPIEADKDKVLRAHAAAPTCEAGRVHYDEGGAWVEDFLEELISFPSGKYDDQVDVFVHGINRLKEVHPFLPTLEDILVDTGFRSIGTQLDPPI